MSMRQGASRWRTRPSHREMLGTDTACACQQSRSPRKFRASKHPELPPVVRFFALVEQRYLEVVGQHNCACQLCFLLTAEIPDGASECVHRDGQDVVQGHRAVVI